MEDFEAKPGAQVHFKLDEGVAFLMTHTDGSRTLHVFRESGTMHVPEDVIDLQQIRPKLERQAVFSNMGGAFVAGSGGGGQGGSQSFFACTVGKGGAGGGLGTPARPEGGSAA